MKNKSNIDKEVLEVVYEVLKSVLEEIEERLFFPKKEDNVIEFKNGEVPF